MIQLFHANDKLSTDVVILCRKQKPARGGILVAIIFSKILRNYRAKCSCFSSMFRIACHVSNLLKYRYSTVRYDFELRYLKWSLWGGTWLTLHKCCSSITRVIAFTKHSLIRSVVCDFLFIAMRYAIWYGSSNQKVIWITGYLDELRVKRNKNIQW